MMSREKPEEGHPVRVEINIYALPAGTDAETLAKAADNVAQILEDEGVFSQRGPAPAHVFKFE